MHDKIKLALQVGQYFLSLYNFCAEFNLQMQQNSD